MRWLNKNLSFFFLLLITSVLGADFALAITLEANYPSVGGLTIGENSTFPDYAKYFFNLGVALAGGLALLAVIFGGVYYLFSLGMGRMTSQGKEWIKAGIMGLLLILCSYLIVNTINPQLVIFRLENLGPIPLPILNPQEDQTVEAEIVNFKEIPIGTLTENVLARARECYDFDADGNPIDGNPDTSDVLEPTFLNHDRLDCIIRLARAIERKSNKMKLLAERLADGYMNECKCNQAGGAGGTSCRPSPNVLEEINRDAPFLNPFLILKNPNENQKSRTTISGNALLTTPFSFSLSIDPASRRILPGESTSATITISASDGPSQNIILTSSSIPRATINLSSTSCTPPCSPITMTVNTNANIPQGYHTITVSANSSGLPTQSANFDLRVRIGNPVGCQAMALGPNSISLNWSRQAMPDNAETRIVRKTGGTFSSCTDGETISLANPNADTSLVDAGLEPATNYSYYLCGYYNGIYSNSACPVNMTTLSAGDPCVKDCDKCEYNTRDVCPLPPDRGGPPDSGEQPGEGCFSPDPTNNVCGGDCVNGACKCDPGCDPCPENYKDMFEHGRDENGNLSGVFLPDDNPPVPYWGLDEFRTEHPDGTLIGEVEIEEDAIIYGQTQRTTVINKDKFFHRTARLRLIDQIKYLKEKIEQINIEGDLNVLENAETELGDCYLAQPYVGFLKLNEKTRKEEKEIKIVGTFDPITNQLIDVSRYCKGFAYGKNQCYQTCQKICPGINELSFSAIENCPPNKENDPDANLVCLTDGFHICPAGTKMNNADIIDFEDCIAGCKGDCHTRCDDLYSSDEQKLTSCHDDCNRDSECLLDNEENCYVDFSALKECADAANSFEAFKNCSKNSFRCQYCTEQQAGYPDCSVCFPNCSGQLTRCGDRPNSEENYSAQFFLENPQCQKCPDCFYAAREGEASYGNIDQNPECAKGPSCSKCPKCACTVDKGTPYEKNEIISCSGDCREFAYNDDPLTFYCPEKWDENWWKEERDDPSQPIGNERSCPLSREIPIGQTVDDAEKWAKELIKYIQDFLDVAGNMIDYINGLGQETGYCECRSACGPGSTGTEYACSISCEFCQQRTTYQYEDPESGEPRTGSDWNCDCVQKPCEGNPCQRMINLLLGKGTDDKCPKGEALPGIEVHRENISEALAELELLPIEKRSEILKKLAYSRKKMDECSEISTTFGEKKIKPFSCQRVRDEQIPPIGQTPSQIKTIIDRTIIKTYCYGKKAGEAAQATEQPLMDNWFCCEKAVRN